MSITTNERAEFTAMMNKASDEIEALRPEVARLKADADRLDAYALMCERGDPRTPMVDFGTWVVPYLDNGAGGSGGGVSYAYKPSFRAAIDDAMKADQP